jgi:hypothetical protein
MTHDTYCRLLDGLKQAKSTLDTLTPAYLSNLNEDEFEIVVTNVMKFFNSVQSAANYLAVLRKQQSA